MSHECDIRVSELFDMKEDTVMSKKCNHHWHVLLRWGGGVGKKDTHHRSKKCCKCGKETDGEQYEL